ncbi:MAG: hypothetical protein ACM37W_16250 [Actinomycetota bacterium]
MSKGNPNFGKSFSKKFDYGREQPLDAQILIRMKSEEKERLTQLAKAEGITAVELVRRAIASLMSETSASPIASEEPKGRGPKDGKAPTTKPGRKT